MSSPSCTGKTRHQSKADALRSITARKGARSRRRGMRVGAYRCPECGGFHIGATRGAR